MDPVLGWMLGLHRDLTIIVVAVMTIALFTLVRKFVTDQEWLKRARDDQDRLKELIKLAKQKKDKEAIKRYNLTKVEIQKNGFGHDLKVLAWVILPILLIGTWAWNRLGFIPPQAGEIVKVKVYMANSAIGRIMHLVPVDGVSVKNGWAKTIEKDTLPDQNWWDKGNSWVMDKMGMVAPLEGSATWEVMGSNGEQIHKLKFFFDGKIYESDFLVGQKIYAPEFKFVNEDPVQAIELQMRPLKLFGIIPGAAALMCPPWLVAYIFIAVGLFFLFKRILKVY
jgi:uncharacterized membrane protein (DUF106 family)